jgi:hypothetical protein
VAEEETVNFAEWVKCLKSGGSWVVKDDDDDDKLVHMSALIIPEGGCVLGTQQRFRAAARGSWKSARVSVLNGTTLQVDKLDRRGRLRLVIYPTVEAAMHACGGNRVQPPQPTGLVRRSIRIRASRQQVDGFERALHYCAGDYGTRRHGSVYLFTHIPTGCGLNFKHVYKGYVAKAMVLEAARGEGTIAARVRDDPEVPALLLPPEEPER